MSTATHKKPVPKAGGRLPASLVDSQLDHLERMVQNVARGDAATVFDALGDRYWENRVRELLATHDLVQIQRRRAERLLELLEQTATIKARRFKSI
ncbi:hypothetical protein [Paraburkholderia phosphatilytica]|uniref:hypothetical protein n=1 Tax=Paraburkholderia phosphatilytica TaxID=2282883 RepID=UPI000F5FF3E1|nr:hypothetical protein [Paraburkholderia phosphatilytica]